jgi:hypothetical protein
MLSYAIPPNAIMIMKSKDIEVYKNVEEEKLPSNDIYQHTIVYIKKGNSIMKFHKNMSGDLVSAEFIKIENDSDISVLKLGWTFSGGFGTAGISGKGETYFAVKEKEILQLNDFRTEFSDEEVTLNAKVQYYYIGNVLYNTLIEKWSYSKKPNVDIAIWSYGDFADIKYQKLIQKLNYKNCIYDSSNNILFSMNDTNINIRARPDIKSDIVGKLKGNELIKLNEIYPEIKNVNATNGYWINITSKDLTGWIWSEYIEKLKDISVIGK